MIQYFAKYLITLGFQQDSAKQLAWAFNSANVSWAFDIANENWVLNSANVSWVFDIANENWALILPMKIGLWINKLPQV